MDYLDATGFEAVMGFLYLTGDLDRACELVSKGIEKLSLDIL
jgi:ribonuclease-3 family protein